MNLHKFIIITTLIFLFSFEYAKLESLEEMLLKKQEEQVKEEKKTQKALQDKLKSEKNEVKKNIQDLEDKQKWLKKEAQIRARLAQKKQFIDNEKKRIISLFNLECQNSDGIRVNIRPEDLYYWFDKDLCKSYYKLKKPAGIFSGYFKLNSKEYICIFNEDLKYSPVVIKDIKYTFRVKIYFKGSYYRKLKYHSYSYTTYYGKLKINGEFKYEFFHNDNLIKSFVTEKYLPHFDIDIPPFKLFLTKHDGELYTEIHPDYMPSDKEIEEIYYDNSIEHFPIASYVYRKLPKDKVYLNEGLALYKKAKKEKDISLLSSALSRIKMAYDINSSDNEIAFWFAVLNKRNANYEKAIELNKYLQDNNIKDVRIELALLYCVIGEYKKSIYWYKNLKSGANDYDINYYNAVIKELKNSPEKIRRYMKYCNENLIKENAPEFYKNYDNLSRKGY